MVFNAFTDEAQVTCVHFLPVSYKCSTVWDYTPWIGCWKAHSTPYTLSPFACIYPHAFLQVNNLTMSLYTILLCHLVISYRVFQLCNTLLWFVCRRNCSEKIWALNPHCTVDSYILKLDNVFILVFSYLTLLRNPCYLSVNCESKNFVHEVQIQQKYSLIWRRKKFRFFTNVVLCILEMVSFLYIDCVEVVVAVAE